MPQLFCLWSTSTHVALWTIITLGAPRVFMHIYQGKIIAQVAFNGYFKRKNLLLEQGLELTNLSSCLGWALSFSQVLASLRLITLPTLKVRGKKISLAVLLWAITDNTA